jgi:CheY-like chemotaxis protein
MAKQKILVVDDNSFMRKLLETRLKANNYQPILADGAEEALEKIQHEKPDLILLDVSMPGMNGFQFAKKIRDDVSTKSIPIIFVTARGQVEEIVEAIRDLGAAAYIIKPFTPEALLDGIKKALDS